MYQDLVQLLYEIAALRYSLKNLHYHSKYARHLLADRLADGEDDTDELAIQAIVDGYQETIFNGSYMPTVPEEEIADNCRKWIIPTRESNAEQCEEIMRAFESCNRHIAEIFPRLDIADQKYLGDIAYSFKHAIGMLWRELYGNNQ